MTAWSWAALSVAVVFATGCIDLQSLARKPGRSEVPRDVNDIARFTGGFAAYRQRLEQLDEDAPDPVVAAGVVVLCAQSRLCNASKSSKSDYNDSVAGTLMFYAVSFDVSDVEAGLAGNAAPVEEQQAFLRNYAIVRQHLLETVAGLSANRKRVYYEPLAAARERWRKEVEALKPFRERYTGINARLEKALMAETVDGALLAEARTLRRSYVAACRELGRDVMHCLGRRVARRLTARLLEAEKVRQNQLGTLAEQILIDNVPSTERLNYELHRVVAESVRREQERWTAYARARDAGISQELLEQKFDPLPLPPERLRRRNLAGLTPPRGKHDGFSYTRLPGGDRLVRLEDRVERVARRGAYATLHFAGKRRSSTVGIGCRETRKVDYINRRTGEIVYRQKCKRWANKTSVDRKPPVRVPLGDVKSVAGGDIIVLHYNGDRQGRVVSVYAPGADNKRSTRKQVGSFRL